MEIDINFQITLITLVAGFMTVIVGMVTIAWFIKDSRKENSKMLKDIEKGQREMSKILSEGQQFIAKILENSQRILEKIEANTRKS